VLGINYQEEGRRTRQLQKKTEERRPELLSAAAMPNGPISFNSNFNAPSPNNPTTPINTPIILNISVSAPLWLIGRLSTIITSVAAGIAMGIHSGKTSAVVPSAAAVYDELIYI
jgi:hypothetical protein